MTLPIAMSGYDDHLYYNTGSAGSPVWVEITSARDVTLTDEFGEGDASIRGDAGLAATLCTLRKLGIEWEQLWKPTATDFGALHPIYLARTPTEFLALDGPSTGSSGAQGPRIACVLTKFARKEPLDGVTMADVVAKRTISGTFTTSWFTA